MNTKSAGYLTLAASLTWGAVVGLLVYGLGDVPYGLAVMLDERGATSVYAQMVITSHDWGGNSPVISPGPRRLRQCSWLCRPCTAWGL